MTTDGEMAPCRKPSVRAQPRGQGLAGIAHHITRRHDAHLCRRLLHSSGSLDVCWHDEPLEDYQHRSIKYDIYRQAHAQNQINLGRYQTFTQM